MSVGKADRLILMHNLQHLCHTTAAPREEGSHTVHKIHNVTQSKESFHWSWKFSTFRHSSLYVVLLLIPRDFTLKSFRIWLFSSCKRAEKSHFDQVQWPALEKKIVLPEQQVGYNAAVHPSKLFLHVHKGCTGDGIHCSRELAAKIHPKSCLQKKPSLRNCTSYALTCCSSRSDKPRNLHPVFNP